MSTKTRSVLSSNSFMLSLVLMSIPAFGGMTKANEPTPVASQLEFFEKEVRPLLAKHCYSCHSVKAEKLQAGLRVDSRKALLVGGDTGASIVPGDAEGSLLIEAVRYESYEMPPKGKLPHKEIAILERWVEMGAPWPSEPEPEVNAARPEFDLEQRKQEHWVWQPVRDPDLPDVKSTNWPNTDADYFILSKLEEAELEPTTDADRTALLRRLYFDLIGLPPTPAQIEQFVSDDSPQVVENVVDELLNSPHFGERWGRHWLDLVRYAESRGHEFDADAPDAYRYRDYIIRALNADVPYDQLVREHIAGDLLKTPRLHPETGANESILGTGFWFLGEWVHSPVDIRKDESDRFDNMVDVMSKTFLGVTVSCARCHDHKFDAISTADYYALTGFLQSSDFRKVRFESIEHNGDIAKRLAELDAEYRTKLESLLRDRGITIPDPPTPITEESVVFDYSQVDGPDYMQNGYLFGPHPRQAGTISLVAGEARNVSIATFSAANSDPFWNDLESITHSQDRSRLAGIPRSGRTLRTPTFELTADYVDCRVSGAGHVVAVVDSHRLINGPLHGQTVQEIREVREWIRLPLGRYKGHRIHLEFTPAKNAQLSVQLVTQGMSEAGKRAIEEQYADQAARMTQYDRTASRILNGEVIVEETVFADFESGNYEGWTATGDAFGDAPQTKQTVARSQHEVNPRGKYFVNSHHTRGPGTPQGDQATGTLLSRPFTIECDSIEFFVGGGSYKEKTCVNLLIDGKVVRTATGRNSNRMFEESWDVTEFNGREAQIQVVDDHQQGWGNIGLDHVVFKTVKRREPAHPAAERIVQEWRAARNELHSRVVRKSHLAMAMMDGTSEDGHILIRGDSSNPGRVEPRHFLTAISGDAPLEIKEGSGRLQLAAHINDPHNPLTSRVIVNRIWHHLMGRGIVPTTDDFGVLGQRPTHPELLDHLATKFMADGQSIKRMIKYIALSRTYQQSSFAEPAARQADPKNLLWHHRPPKRLQGEAIRDALLQLSGKLDRTQFGQPVPIHLTPFMDGRGRPGQSGPLDGNGRRSIYISVRRNFLSPFMLAFDTPVPFSSMGRRNVSNVPAQALILMNDPFVIEQAKGWAQRAIQSGETTEARISWMYQTAFAREPTAQEMATATAFIDELKANAQSTGDDVAVWSDLAHALINTKEFIFLR